MNPEEISYECLCVYDAPRDEMDRSLCPWHSETEERETPVVFQREAA